MKSIIVGLLIVMTLSMNESRRHHHTHHRKEDNIVDHQKCKKCQEFGQSSPRLWNNVLFCGDKNEPQHHLELSDAECCLVAPGQCAQAFKNVKVKGVQLSRLRKTHHKHKQDEVAAASAPVAAADGDVQCMYCVHHTCTMTQFSDAMKVKCIASLYLCAQQKDKDEIFKWINNFDRQFNSFVNSDKKKRFKLNKRKHQ